MKARKSIVLLLISCLFVSLFTIGAAAADGSGLWGTGLSTGKFISLAIGIVAVLAIVVLCIVKRVALAESLRAYKSEMKKITWYSWKNVVRSTVFVVVSVLVVALVVGLLDIAFFELQYMLTGQGVSFFGG